MSSPHASQPRATSHPQPNKLASRVEYSVEQFRGYAPILRETFAVLTQDYTPEGVDIPLKTLDDLQWRSLLEALAHGCASDEAHRAALRLPFLRHRESIERRHREVEEAGYLAAEDVAIPLQGLDSVQKALDHARRGGTLDGETLLKVARVGRVAQEVFYYFKSRAHLAPLLAQVGEDVQPVPELVQTLQRAFDPSGRLADHASPELGELRRRVQNYHERLKRRVEGYLKSTDLQTHLQDNYYTLRNERYVLPVKSGSRGHLPGIVHGTSGSGQTLFIEPTELVELNNDLQLAQMEVAEEEQRILGRLSGLVAQGAAKLEGNGGLLAYLDLTSAMARLSSLLRASRPTLSTRGALVLTQARHPLLVLRALSAEKPFEVIPNDIELGELVLPPKPVQELAALAAGGEQEEGALLPEAVPTRQQILIISGPNAGGKTVTLKTMGLCCLMARAGMHVPADPGAEVPLVNSVFSDIGDEQSIERDLSTFSGHVVNLSGFLRRVDDKSLVLLDELFAGTDPAQGAALARAVLTWLAEKGALVAVTTHLETLKTLAFQDARFANAAVGFDLDQLRPTYALHIGLPGSSYALRIAQRLGLPQGILDRAWQHSDNAGQADIERVLRQLERQRDKLSHERDQVRRLKQEADTIKKDYDKQLADLRKREERMVHKETRALMAEVETARDLIRRHIKALHEAPAREAAGGPAAMTQEQLHETRKEVNEVAQKASDLLKEKEVELVRQERAPALPNRLQEGQEVWVRTFKRTGQVVELQHDRGRAVVQVGGIRATVTLEELYQLKNGEGAPIPKPRPVHADTPAKNETSLRIVGPQTPDNTVDLRGLMVDEALERLEIFLDAAYRAQEAGAYVIHGHGTGALKRAVRQFAAQARYLAHHRPGEQGEGGDGVTLVFFEN